MKATFSSTKKIDFKPIDNNETVLLNNLVDISNNDLQLVKDEKYNEISLVIAEPKLIVAEDNLAGRIINMNFPERIRDMLDSHRIMTMKDGSYIECVIAYPEELIEIPAIKWEETGKTDPGMGTKEVKCTCGMVKNVFTSVGMDDVSLTTEHEEEHKTTYVENFRKQMEDGTCDDNCNCNGDDDKCGCKTEVYSDIPEGYYSDPSAPNGYRKCRPGHIHGATYIHPICCIHGDHQVALTSRTVIVRLVSETLGEVVLFSLVGIDDVRINMKLFKVDTTTDMRVEEVNKNSIFYDAFKI